MPAALANVSAERSTIEKAYNLQNKAVEQKNITIFMSIYTPDFHGKLLDGRVFNCEQVRQKMIKLFAGSTYLSGKVTIQVPNAG